jgi:glycerophosphoryl diester phosphodiesterase
MPYDWYLKGDKRDFGFRTAAGLDLLKRMQRNFSVKPFIIPYKGMDAIMMESQTISIRTGK